MANKVRTSVALLAALVAFRIFLLYTTLLVPSFAPVLRKESSNINSAQWTAIPDRHISKQTSGPSAKETDTHNSESNKALAKVVNGDQDQVPNQHGATQILEQAVAYKSKRNPLQEIPRKRNIELESNQKNGKPLIQSETSQVASGKAPLPTATGSINVLNPMQEFGVKKNKNDKDEIQERRDVRANAAKMAARLIELDDETWKPIDKLLLRLLKKPNDTQIRRRLIRDVGPQPSLITPLVDKIVTIPSRDHLLHLGTKLSRGMNVTTVWVGASNTIGRNSNPFREMFASYSKPGHKFRLVARSGASSCYFATHFKHTVRPSLQDADFVVVEFSVNDLRNQEACFESILRRIHNAQPYATILIFAIETRKDHSTISNYYQLPVITLTPIMDRFVLQFYQTRNGSRADFLPLHSMPANRDFGWVREGRSPEVFGDVLLRHDYVHIDNIASYLFSLALLGVWDIAENYVSGAQEVADMSFEEQRKQNKARTDEMWGESMYKPVDNFDVKISFELGTGITLSPNVTSKVVDKCSYLLRRATVTPAERDKCGSFIVEQAVPYREKAQESYDFLSDDHNRQSTMTPEEISEKLDDTYCSTSLLNHLSQTKSECIASITPTRPKHNRPVGGGWFTCFDLRCREITSLNQHCSQADDRVSGAMVQYVPLDVRRWTANSEAEPLRYNRASVSISHLQGYTAEFSTAIVVAWVERHEPHSSERIILEPVLLDSKWDRKWTIPQVLNIGTLELPAGDSNPIVYVVVLPLNDVAKREPPCRIDLFNILVEYS